MLLSWLTSALGVTKLSTVLWTALAFILAVSLSFGLGMYHEARNTRTELIAAQDTARKAGAEAVKKEFEIALKNANDLTKKAERERDDAKASTKTKTIVRTIHDRVRVPGVCEFTPEDIHDINAAGH